MCLVCFLVVPCVLGIKNRDAATPEGWGFNLEGKVPIRLSYGKASDGFSVGTVGPLLGNVLGVE